MNQKQDRENLRQKVQRSVESFRMIRRGDTVIAGVSGGADSVCLLHLLAGLQETYGFSLEALHVEHGLRGEESLADADFTRDLCEMWQIPCRVVHVDAAAEAKRRHLSMEEAARTLRYQAFEDRRAELGQAKIATAHHLEDQAETVLMNLARGTGLKGLGGIRPVNGYLIRPLLDAGREEIEAYLQDLGQTWCTDRTNLSDAYTRNLLRHQVLPVLQGEVNSAAFRHIAEAALEAQRTEAFLRDMAGSCMQTTVYLTEDPLRSIHIQVDRLEETDPLLQEYILRMAIERLRGGQGLKDISREHIRQLRMLSKKDVGRRLELPAGLRAVRDYKEIRLFEAAEVRKEKGGGTTLWEYELPASGSGMLEIGGRKISWRRLERAGVPDPLPQMRYTKWLAYDTMNGNICLRGRRPGDYLVVTAQGGRKSLKDYLIDCKVPAGRRNAILVAAQGSHVLWVIGLRISEAAKVRSDTKQVLEISVQEAEDGGAD